MGLRLSPERTRISHIDEGFDFLGWYIVRQTKRGTNQRYVYTYPSHKVLQAIKTKVKALTTGSTNQSLTVLLHRLNPVLRGWTTYFRAGTSSRTFNYLGYYTWHRVTRWLRRKHPGTTWKQLRRRYLPESPWVWWRLPRFDSRVPVGPGLGQYA